MVGHWNAYFDAMMFLRDKNYYPLQVFLRQILVLSQMGDMEEQGGVDEVIFAHFDKSLMEMDWKEFVDKVAGQIRDICDMLNI